MQITPALASLVFASLATLPAAAQQIDLQHWGDITAPVFGITERAPFTGADLFAGPNKFGAYYNGVLPNGRIVKPAGQTTQVGMSPLGIALTPDGRYLVTSNDNERDSSLASIQNPTNIGAYSLSVVDTNTMTVVSQVKVTGAFIGLQVTGSGPYTVWASGGVNNDVKLFTLSAAGIIAAARPANIVIAPITPATAGYVSNYVADPTLNRVDPASGNRPNVPTQMSRTTTAITFPAGSTLSPDGKFLYVACNGDNSIAVIDTAAQKVVRQIPAGYFPYTVTVSKTGIKVAVSNWGVTEYKFQFPTYTPAGGLLSVTPTDSGEPNGFFVPITNTDPYNPKTSSVSIMTAPGGNGAALSNAGAIYHGRPLDALSNVGDTHPSAMAIVNKGSLEVLFVTKTNDDSLGMMVLNNNRKLPDFDLSPFHLKSDPPIHGTYPNALAVSPDNNTLYVAEAGLNSVAVLDVRDPLAPRLTGRIPTGWYPSSLTVSLDGKFLYIANAKGVAEDINPATDTNAPHSPTGLASYDGVDSNYVFGTVQKVDLSQPIDTTTALANNFAVHHAADTTVVPTGGAPSNKIKHVFFILQENKTFDSMVGNMSDRFGAFAATTFNDKAGKPFDDPQYTGVTLNTQLLARKFAVAANYYSDSEESDAGHQFAASGTATDFSEKTLNVKSGRGLLVNKNMDPEDYPESGYIFNNAARNGIDFKVYGALFRVIGTDTGTGLPTVLNDPASGLLGYPTLQADNLNVMMPIQNAGDVTSETLGLGQSFYLTAPALAVLGSNNPNGEPRLDHFYPGYNFNISDQRRAQEFMADFDGMIADGTVPQFFYIYVPNNHTGSVQSANAAQVQPKGKNTSTQASPTAAQQVADGDVAIGMIVNHIMNSPLYYDAATDTGSAIFMTYDDAQSTLDHIHPHRTPLTVVSPFAKPAYTGLKHYSTASIVKTEELLLGLPPNNIHDLMATDLRDMFQPVFNGITAAEVPVTRPEYLATEEGRKIWELVTKLDTSAPDRDSARLGELGRLSMRADQLHKSADAKHELRTRAYRKKQSNLYKSATKLVNGPKPKDADDR
jgi:YVTN family beta-propeller protein